MPFQVKSCHSFIHIGNTAIVYLRDSLLIIPRSLSASTHTYMYARHTSDPSSALHSIAQALRRSTV
jgi:hypothetical protein